MKRIVENDVNILGNNNLSFMAKSDRVVYVIEGKPIPLARARCSNTMVYDSQKHHKLIVGLSLRKQHGCRHFYTGPLHLEVTFFIKKPQKKGKYTWHYTKPDLSNLIKFIEDVSTSILYDDDCLISSCSAKKVYTDNERTEFTITELKKV